MLTHSLSRRTRAALGAAIAALAITALPALAHAEPRATHATDELTIGTPSALLDVCPISGASTFEDSWGWARSGGRRHEGVDMIAERGTAIVAVRDGYAQFKTNGLGGRAIWLTAPDGDKFYYAHLDSWEGESRDVMAGDLIGYVGSSGNARGAHLHFETLPSASVENPFPHTLQACVPTPEELANAGSRLNDAAFRTRFVPGS
jgi:murein DD-endopeptidase MepM/ murein hydrolase activator NlpD